jgi:cytochrome c
MKVFYSAAVALGATTIMMSAAHAANEDSVRGQRSFGACAACHSLQPDRNMTGPSLAGLWDRKAGTLPSFSRYSPALKSSGIVWTDATLDKWLADPQQLAPGNTMTFPGIQDGRVRADLLAFLKDATQPGHGPPSTAEQGRSMGGMMGMMRGGAVPDLKKIASEDRVQAIRYCGDTYHVTTADGKTRDFWERNLRFKTDSGSEGPEKGAAALVGAGMMGDRADVIFAAPEEMSAIIARECNPH